MFNETCEILSNASTKKSEFLKKSKGKYLVASILAGFYVGLGIFLIMTIGGLTKPLGPQFRIFMGMGFGIALSLVIMAGSELFTGNNMVMIAGLYSKKVSMKDLGKIWSFSYFGNLIGSILVGVLFVYAGSALAPHKEVGGIILGITELKTTAPILDLIVKGILCNILVCLAVLCSLKMKSESGKLIMIWWCLFAFITSGYEHSIANMSIFTAALALPNSTISVGAVAYNLLWTTVGNIIGGSILGLAYAYMGSEKK